MKIDKRTNLPTVPIRKILRRLLSFVRNPLPFLLESHEIFGDTYLFRAGGYQPMIVTRDPEFARHILQKNHKNYVKSEIQTKILANYVGKGLLTSEGSYWLRQRRLIQPGFHKERLKAITSIMREVVLEKFQNLKDIARIDGEVDMYEFSMEVAFEVVARTLFSSDIKEESLKELSETITAVQNFLIKEVRQPHLRLWYKYSGQQSHYKKIAKRTSEVIRKLIRDRQAMKNKPDDLLTMLMEARYKDTNQGMTEDQLLDECLILFVAGHETTANALAWIAYILSSDQHIADKLKAEISSSWNSNKFDFDLLRRIPYTTALINETLRFYPPAWITDRVSVEKDRFGDVIIPPKTVVVPLIYAMHHAESSWNDPETFNPDRFLGQNEGKAAFFPFGAGPRLCIGNHFAIMEMQIVCAEIFSKFSFKIIDESSIKMLPLVTLRPEFGIMVKVSEN